MATITYATADDLPWLKRHDAEVGRAVLADRVARGEVIVARHDGRIVGWMRFGLFADVVPYMKRLSVVPSRRRRGIGTQLVRFWEREMRHRGFRLVMTASQADEEGQHFYRRLGYTDSGGYVLPGEPLEIIFHKSLE
jgi:ribosomal protein S18 acetylase RimI-like enzyme